MYKVLGHFESVIKAWFVKFETFQECVQYIAQQGKGEFGIFVPGEKPSESSGIWFHRTT